MIHLLVPVTDVRIVFENNVYDRECMEFASAVECISGIIYQRTHSGVKFDELWFNSEINSLLLEEAYDDVSIQSIVLEVSEERIVLTSDLNDQIYNICLCFFSLRCYSLSDFHQI